MTSPHKWHIGWPTAFIEFSMPPVKLIFICLEWKTWIKRTRRFITGFDLWSILNGNTLFTIAIFHQNVASAIWMGSKDKKVTRYQYKDRNLIPIKVPSWRLYWFTKITFYTELKWDRVLSSRPDALQNSSWMHSKIELTCNGDPCFFCPTLMIYVFLCSTEGLCLSLNYWGSMPFSSGSSIHVFSAQHWGSIPISPSFRIHAFLSSIEGLCLSLNHWGFMSFSSALRIHAFLSSIEDPYHSYNLFVHRTQPSKTVSSDLFNLEHTRKYFMIMFYVPTCSQRTTYASYQSDSLTLMCCRIWYEHGKCLYVQ